MQRRENNVKISGEKLRAELKKRNLLISKASLEMGFANTTLGKWAANNSIPKYALIILTQQYNILEKDIVLNESGEEPLQTKKVDSTNDILEKLEKIDQDLITLTEFLKIAWGVKG